MASDEQASEERHASRVREVVDTGSETVKCHCSLGLTMKASELQPGQFFEFANSTTRYRKLAISADFASSINQPVYCIDREYKLHKCAACVYVKPLAVTGWEDEPPVAKPEPEQFAAGDWLVCTESHAPLVAGKVYKVLAVKDSWPEVEEGQGYWNPKYFRRATDDEIAANKPDADGWIEHDGNGCPVDGDTLIEVRCANGATEKGLAKEWVAGWNSNKWRFDIIAYRLVNPPTPELTWTVTT